MNVVQRAKDVFAVLLLIVYVVVAVAAFVPGSALDPTVKPWKCVGPDGVPSSIDPVWEAEVAESRAQRLRNAVQNR